MLDPNIVVLFATTLALRPLLRFASQQWSTSWLQLQGRVFCICFLTGSLATYIISLVTFGYRGFRLSYWTLSGVQCSLILFLWAALYLGVRQRNGVQLSLPVEQSSAPNTSLLCDKSKPVFATTFAVRTGNRLEMVSVDRVLWIAASRDYVELHTKSSTHLLRDTMTSLVLRLDPSQFKRIHRSRIVRTDQIETLTPLENGEFRVKLHDGSEHRSSRTYASVLTEWMRSGAGEPVDARPRQQ